MIEIVWMCQISIDIIWLDWLDCKKKCSGWKSAWISMDLQCPPGMRSQVQLVRDLWCSPRSLAIGSGGHAKDIPKTSNISLIKLGTVWRLWSQLYIYISRYRINYLIQYLWVVWFQVHQNMNTWIINLYEFTGSGWGLWFSSRKCRLYKLGTQENLATDIKPIWGILGKMATYKKCIFETMFSIFLRKTPPYLNCIVLQLRYQTCWKPLKLLLPFF